jgi:hypothetical protein
VSNRAFLLRYLQLTVVACITLLTAHYIRYELIEPVALGVQCTNSSNWRCQLRELAIFALQQSRLGWCAIGLVIAAYFTRRFVFAIAACWVACVGLVLYTPELCAIALLATGLVALRGQKVLNQAGKAIQSQ